VTYDGEDQQQNSGKVPSARTEIISINRTIEGKQKKSKAKQRKGENPLRPLSKKEMPIRLQTRGQRGNNKVQGVFKGMEREDTQI
jgi:hypothetical protein